MTDPLTPEVARDVLRQALARMDSAHNRIVANREDWGAREEWESAVKLAHKAQLVLAEEARAKAGRT